ncbi:anti-anti-sigma factor [Motilibacter rhizosphaerae]|uniref:Anti-sigma factor antagonist n=1 Tax=Motilibacter rhizosphaerae TaxID=598652 RepID=A0A4Q7NR09_9ACTN|nr:STAS domain-containing protein [Motilibacter rhizosphaerae]RZS87466.1 anti-anti-sigma factor [Motilibacter rhizosphaerae]
MEHVDLVVPTVLVLEGEIDLHRSEELRTAAVAFEASGATVLVVDLSAVTFLDSAGLAFLARVARCAQQRGGLVRVLRPTPIVRRALEVSGLLALLHVLDAE